MVFCCPEQLFESSRPPVRPLIIPSVTFVKKWPLGYQMVTKTYLPSNLYDSTDNSDSSESSDRSKSWTVVTVVPVVTKKTYFTIFLVLVLVLSHTKKFHKKKLNNSTFDETKKLKLWWSSKTQIVMKLKYANRYKT